MTNETPVQNVRPNRRLEDRLAAAKAGKSCRIVVPGKCRVCKRKSADVPATRNQVMAWFATKETKGFLAYQVRMLTEGLHRDCQKVADLKVKEKAAKKAHKAKPLLVPMDADKLDRVRARANQNGRVKRAPIQD